ncbi:MAG: acyltransferase [Bauldia sp.]|nr:acyltransferase [Bauldia sp.]
MPIVSDSGSGALRHDIQMLRGFAVLCVVFYHIGMPGFRAGYLGVDVFFVISGFLMMRILASDQDAGRLSIARFYLRRARRLLPAALATIAVTTVLGLFVLARWEWDAYPGQAFGALTFTANIVAWTENQDYFAPAAETLPLLHFWSLSLEEQFYLLLPLALLLAGRRYRLAMVVVAATASIVACFVVVPRSPAAAFYLLPTRAWELLLGAAAAGVAMAWPRLRIGWPVQAAGALVVIALVFVTIDPVHPRLDALLACLATAAILLGADRGRLAGWPGRLLGRIGDISYSLYLVHWPLLAFATIAFFGAVPAAVRLGIVAVALVLAALQYRFVEQPFRRARGGRRGTWLFAGGVLAAGIAIAIGVAYLVYVRPDGPAAELRRPNYGLGHACELTEPTFTAKPECQTTASPTTALWGDSFAMQWATGLRDLPGGLIQITRSACPPVVGMTAGPAATDDWVGRCFVFHQSAFDYILASPDITTVVLSGNLRLFTNDGVTMLADPATPAATSADAARIAYGRMIRTLEAAGKRVVFIAAMPTGGFDIGACLERVDTGLLILGGVDCSFRTAAVVANDGAVMALLDAIATDTGITVVWPAAAFCDAIVCRPTLDGVPLYRDRAHIPRNTTPLLAAAIDLPGIVTGTTTCTRDPADTLACAVLRRPDWAAR